MDLKAEGQDLESVGLEVLVEQMRDGTSAEKGLRLEELASRLFASVPGFEVQSHVWTQTEEIDLRIYNGSDDPLWRNEKAWILVECKNWSGQCGKDELVLFRSKLQNRSGRVSCGFLVSWNGFTNTVSKELLRATQGDLVVVPIAGRDLRDAVRESDFPARLRKLFHDIVFH
jgi:restriction endonuclease